MQSRELYFKNHKNARHISASGRWLTARTRNNSSTWLPSAITPEKSGSHSPPCTNTQHEILLFITSCIRGDLLFSRLTGATQVLQNFFALKRKLKAHLLETEDIHFVCADQRTTDKVRNKGAVFSTFTQVPVKATHMLIYKNLFFFFRSLSFLCLLMQLHTDLQCRWRWGEGYTWLIIAFCVKNTIIPAIATRLTTNQRIFGSERGGRGVMEKKAGPREKERQARRLKECQGQRKRI